MTSSSGISAETILTHPSRSGQALHQQGLGKWKAVRPWKPPESADSVRDSLDMDGAGSVGTGEQRGERNASPRLRLEVVDVSSTAVSLAFFTEQEQHTDDDTEETSTQAAQRPSRAPDADHEGASVSGSQPCTPSAISIKVNSAPWPHVAHSGPLLGDIRGRHEGIHDTQATAEGAIVVYGLEPGSLYEVELDALGEHQLLDPERSMDSTPSIEASDYPPPPYSSVDPSPHPPLPTEGEVRIHLKKVRATAKRDEGAIASSILTLKKSLDKASREDQRSRQRVMTLEETIRRVKISSTQDTSASEELEARLPDLLREEESLRDQLASRQAAMEETEREAKERQGSTDPVVRDLQVELDGLTASLEEVLLQQQRYERDVIPNLISRLAKVEDDLRRRDGSSRWDSETSGFSRRTGPRRGPRQKWHSSNTATSSNTPALTRRSSFGAQQQASSPPWSPNSIAPTSAFAPGQYTDGQDSKKQKSEVGLRRRSGSLTSGGGKTGTSNPNQDSGGNNSSASTSKLSPTSTWAEKVASKR